MKTNEIKIVIALALICISYCQAELPLQTVQLSSYAINSSYPQFPGYFTLNAAAGKYVLLSSDDVYFVYARDNHGIYSKIFSYNGVTGGAQILTTNGNWFVGKFGTSISDTFKLLENGTFVTRSSTEFITAGSYIRSMNDDTIVIISQYDIETIQFNGQGWQLIDTLPGNFSDLSFYPFADSGYFSVPHLTDSTLAVFETYQRVIKLFTRNENKTWNLVGEVPVDYVNAPASRIIWDGKDTLITIDGNYGEISQVYGRMFIHEKLNNGTYNVTKIIKGSEISSTPGYFGQSVLQVDANFIVIGCPGITANQVGQVFYFQRINGEWQFTKRFIGPATSSYFGFSLLKNDYEIFVQSGDKDHPDRSFLFTIPCNLPIQYRCLDLELESDTCHSTNISTLYNQLYSVGDNCTSVNMTGYTTEGDMTTVTFEFSRDWSDTFYCNATVTCLKPPTASPTGTEPSAEPTTQSPVSAPSSSRTPTKPGKTSSSTLVRISLMTVLSVVTGWFFA